MDITPLVRAQTRCRDSARVGVTLAGLTGLLVFAGWWWAAIPVTLAAAAYGTAQCSRVAAITHLLACVVVFVTMGIWLADARQMTERYVRLLPQPWWMIGLTAVILAFATALLFLGVHGAFTYQRRLPKCMEALPLASRYWLRRCLAWFRSPRLPAILGASLAGALCIVPAAVPVALMLTGRTYLVERALDVFGTSWWIVGVYSVGFLAGAWGLAYFTTKAKRLSALASHEVRWADPRQPILLLRSFADDVTPLHRDIEPGARHQISWIYPKLWTLEETIELALGVWGPVIAIGRPGESLPPAGAAREYVSHENAGAGTQPSL